MENQKENKRNYSLSSWGKTYLLVFATLVLRCLCVYVIPKYGCVSRNESETSYLLKKDLYKY